MTTPATPNLDRILKLVSRKQLISVVESQQAPKSLWTGAVSSGKTIASLIAFIIALCAAPDQGLIVIVGRTLQTIERNIIDPLQSWTLFGELSKSVHHTKGSNTATILGREVHLVGAHNNLAEGRIRGATIALAYVDEATLIPQSFWMMLMSRLRVGDLSKLLATTNPDGPAHHIRKDFLLKAAEIRLAHWHFTIDDNPSLTANVIHDLQQLYVGLWYRRFILGQWCLAEGAVYDMWDEDRHVVDILPPIRHWIGCGIDYGTTNAFSAHLLGLGADNRLYITHEYRYDSKRSLRSKSPSEYSEDVRAWLANAERPHEQARGIRPDWVYVDPAAADFSLQLYRDGLTNVAHANNAVLPGIRTVSSLLARDRLRVARRCTGLIEEFPGYSWDSDAAQKGEDKPIKVEDHSLDDVRYVAHSTEPIWQPALRLPVAA